MNTKLSLLSFCFALLSGLVLLSQPSLAQNADFKLVNKTGYPISEVYVSPSKSRSWGKDVLGRHIIDDGEAWDLTFPQSKSQCVQDMKIVFEDDNSSVIWDGFDLCEIHKITLIYNRKTDQTSAITE
jgi:hypothetical protein